MKRYLEDTAYLSLHMHNDFFDNYSIEEVTQAALNQRKTMLLVPPKKRILLRDINKEGSNPDIVHPYAFAKPLRSVQAEIIDQNGLDDLDKVYATLGNVKNVALGGLHAHHCIYEIVTKYGLDRYNVLSIQDQILGWDLDHVEYGEDPKILAKAGIFFETTDDFMKTYVGKRLN